MNLRNYLLAGFLLLVILAAGAYWQYNKPRRNLTNTTADLSISATDLYRQFAEDEARANANYLDKIIKVQGTLKLVSRAESGTLNLALATGSEMGDVTCEIPGINVPERLSLEVGQPITVKGQCTGFLMDVVLVKCVIVK